MFKRLKRNLTNHLLKSLYNIKCKEIEEVYLPSKKVNFKSESINKFKRVLWNDNIKLYDIKDIQGKKGVNSIGFFKENIGLSHAARYFTRTLQHEKIPFIAKQFDIKNDEKNNHEFDENLSEKLIYNTNIFNFNSNYCMEYLKCFPGDLQHKYNIGYGYWEFEKYPLTFLNQNNFFDEIWAPTDFILCSLCQYYAIPVVKIPVAIDFDITSLKQYTRKYFNLPENAFIFIFTFDVGSEIGGRKNSFGVIEAFNKAFPKGTSDVYLVIKTAPRTSVENNPQHREILDKLEEMAQQHNIILCNRILSDNEMRALINNCQVYVSLHRCEGLGLGMIEAMKMGKPVVATGYSGNTDFMKPYNSCLVDYKLIPSTLFTSLIQGHVWAEPDIEHAVYYMKKLYNDSMYYTQIANKAKEFVDTYHNYHVVGDKIKHRLKLLGLSD